jgi:protein-tyrosine-phosphatase
MTEKIHSAKIEIVSRGNTRKGSWSTKRVRAAMQKHGYEINGVDPDKPDNQLIQVIIITGTRDEIISQREDIASTLRSIATTKVPTRFKLIN